METVDLETSIVNHATARPTSDLATAALQEQAKRWMTEHRRNYLVVTSQLVVAEATAAMRKLQREDGPCRPTFPFSPRFGTSSESLTNWYGNR